MNTKILIALRFVLLSLIFVAAGANKLFAQDFNYSNGALSVSIRVIQPCSGSNGAIRVTVNSTDDGGPAQLAIFGPVNLFGVPINPGNTYTHNPGMALPVGNYTWIVDDGSTSVGSITDPVAYPLFTLATISSPSINKDLEVNNTSCASPNGQVQGTINNGSKVLAGGGSFTYTWTADNGMTGLPTNIVTNGVAPINLATELGVPGLRAGSYTLFVQDNYSQCSATTVFTITDPSPATFAITNPSPLIVCTGSPFTITLSGSENNPVNYEIIRNGTPTGLIFPGDGSSPFQMNVASAGFSDGDVIQVRATNGFCTPVTMTGSVALDIVPLPVPTLTGGNLFCEGTTGVTYNTDLGMSNYTWIVTGGTITAGGGINDASVTVTWTTPGAQSVSVNYQDANGCSAATPTVLPVTVNPLPVLVNPQAKTICTGDNVAYEILSTPANTPAGTLFNWPDPDGVGPATAGVNVPMGPAGTIHINDILTNTTSAPITVTYQVTPTSGAGCPGVTRNVVITVSPRPVLVTPQSKTICSGTSAAYEILLTPANQPALTTFSWPDPDGAGPATAGVNVPMGAAGTTHINDVLTNVSGAPTTVTYVITPSTAGCAGTPQNVVITVNPAPVLVTPQAKSICTGDNVAYEILLAPANLPTGTTFSWPDPDGAGPATAGVNVPMGPAGTLHINDVLTNATSAPITVTYQVTPTSGTGCPGATQPVVITVNPRPVLVTPQTKTICSGDNTAYEILLNPANLPTGTTFSWPDPDGAGPATAGVNVPMGTAGTTHINDVLTNATSAPITVTYVITPTTGSCAGTPQNVVITVNPRPVLVTPQTKTICTGDNVAYEILLTPANQPAGTTFSWPDPDGAGPATAGVNVPMGPAGTIHINDVLTNATSAPITVIYQVTPTGPSGCPGVQRDVVITVTPRPVLVVGQSKTICAGQNTAYEILLNPANLPAGTVFNWPDPDGAGPATAGVNVPMGVAGTTHINNVLTNGTGAPINVTYVVTPSVNGCAGTPQNVVITVNPAPVLVNPQNKTICSGDNVAKEILLNPANLPAGTVFNWPDPDGAGPATAGVNVPMGPAGTIHINDVLVNTTAANITVTYRVTPSGPSGCPGTPRNIVITVRPRPVLVTPQAKTICSGSNVAYEILLTPANQPTGTTFSWPDPDGAGPATAGVNVPMGPAGTIHINDVLTNTTSAPIVVTYQVTPSGPGPGACAGATQNIDITVNPSPVLVNPQAKTICSGSNTAYEILLNPANLPVGTLFNWPDPDGAGPATAGVNVPMGTAGTTHINDVLTNTTGAPVVVNYVVTPSLGGCSGTPVTVAITVDSAPVLVTPQTKAICSGENVAYEILLNPANLPLGTTFSWPDPDGAGPATAGVNVPMGAAGTIHINDVLTNATSAPITVTYQVTPTSGAGCIGATQDVVITVNPGPVLVTPQAKVICNGDNVAYEILLNPANLPAGTTFSWPDPDGAGPATAGLNVPMGAAGTIHINDVLTNTTSAPITVTYQVTPTAAGCVGVTRDVVITVNPTPVLVTPQAKTICSGDNVAYEILLNPANLPLGTTFSWADPDGAGPATAGVNVPMGAAGTIHINDVLTNTTAAPVNVTYVVTASIGGSCPGTPVNVVITVVPAADAGIDGNAPACNTETAFDLFAVLGGTPQAGGTWTDTDGSGAVITGNLADFTAVAPGSYDFAYQVNGVAPCAPDVATVTITISDGPNAGVDANPTVCNTNNAFDLFAAVGPTADAGGTWTDLDASGGILTGNIVDLTPVAPGNYRFRYVVTSGGPCPNDTSVVTINVINTAPDGGSDSTVAACNNETAFNLFNSIAGSPDPGGTWSDLDASGAVITGNTVNLTTLAAGTYRFQYDLAVAGCGGASSIVTVNVTDGPDAGTGNPAASCSSNNAFDLFAVLTGTPDAGGVWIDADASGAVITGNIADLSSITVAGTYDFQYVVVGTGPCANDTATVALTIALPANAGGDNTVDVCNAETAFGLLSGLTGTPDVTGTWTDLDGSGAVITGNFADFSGVAPGTYNFRYEVAGTAPCINDIAILVVNITPTPDAGGDGNAPVCTSETAFDLFAQLTGTPDIGGTWVDADGSGAVISGNNANFAGVAAGVYEFQYVVTGLPCDNDTASVVVTVTVSPDAGIPDSVTACNTDNAFDLFTNLDGTPDAGGIWTDLDASGGVITGNLIDLTTVGVVPGTYRFRYIVTGTGLCANDTSVLTINVINTTPDPGTDNTVSACNSETAFNLFASLGGTPDPGGIWTDLDGSGATITGDNVNLTAVSAGTFRFRYDINVAGCGSASAIVTINVTDGPNAGIGNPATTCNTDNSFDLFAQLTGSPDATGSWVDADGSGATITGNIADFTGIAAGTYEFQYVVVGTSPCVNDTAFVAVTIGTPPNAGTDNPAAASCASETTFDLFGALGGTPDNGGVWTDMNSSGATITGNNANFTGVTVAGSYIFRYIVSGTGPCANDTSFVTVQIALPANAGTDGTATACNSDDTFNLFNVLGAPKQGGGTWTDIDGSTAVITGDIANLTTVAAGTYDFRYIVTGTGACANDTSFVTLTITNGPSAAVAGPDQTLCGVFVTNLAATPVTSGTGTWVIASGGGGLVVAPNSPTSQFIGANGVSYMLRWIVTAGTCAPEIDTVIVNFSASPVVTSPVTICVNAAAPILAANASGALSYNWYQGTGPSRVLLANTPTGSFTPGAELDRTVPGSVTYEVTAVYSCGESPGSQIVVNVSNTGACGGGGTGNCATVVITPVRTPATCTNSDGGVTFNIVPAVPAVNPHGVILTIKGISATNSSVRLTQYNDPVFVNLPAGDYQYMIVYGDSINCKKPGLFTIDQSGTVGTPFVSNIVNPTCAGSSTGAVILDVPGETGNLLEWSINGIDWTPFTAGSQITGLPAGPAPTFELVISVRRNSSDPCNAFVRVVLQDQNPAITATFDSDPATCGNADGSIHSIVAGGGSGGGYEFSINGIDFQPEDEFNDLTGGGYTLTVRDGVGCTETFAVNVTFPGFIDFSVVAKDPISCAVLGELEVSFDDPGTYEVGVSFDPGVEPEQYEAPYISSGAGDIPKRILNLNGGDYYVFVKTSGASCPTRKGPFTIFGPKAISFNTVVECINNTLVLRLTDVQGESGNVDITVLNELLTPVEQFTETLTPGGSILINSEFHPFMSDDGRYIIQLSQTDVCQIVQEEPVDIPATITAAVVGIKESYPDIMTGAFTVTNFAGGIVPYDIKIELDQAAVGGQTFETDFEEVEKNNNLDYEKKYQAIPAGLYNIYIVDSIGCNITMTALVPLDTDIFVPNLFTPNNDGHNEVFFVRNLPAGNNQLVITNRWGKQVFKSNAYQNDWSAEGVIDGIYFYQLKPEGKDAVTGWVEVLRGQKP